MKKGKYYEWDENDFVLPEKYQLGKNASLVEALNVFWSAGGLDFFNVTDPRYYASNWLDFLGMLYRRIADGEFVVSTQEYTVPLTAQQKEELLDHGVPAIFVTDISGGE